jgi:hypothetical protein
VASECSPEHSSVTPECPPEYWSSALTRVSSQSDTGGLRSWLVLRFFKIPSHRRPVISPESHHGRSYSDALVFLGIPNFFLYKNKYIYRYTICIIHIDVYLIVLELKVSQVANFAWPTMARTGKARPSGHGPSAVVPPPASFPYLLPCATRSSSSFCDYDSRLEQSNSFPIPNSPSRP